MAKGKNETTPAEDYIDQLHWRAQHRRWMPVRFEPKWKYKIVYRYPPTTIFDRSLNLVLVIVIIIMLGSLFTSDVAPIGEKIFFGSIFGSTFLIIFFAIRDISKDTDKKSDD